MTQTTILEKLKIIFEVSASSKLFIAVIAFILLLAIVALTTNKKNASRGKKLYGLVYAAISIAIIIFYHESLGQMFDYMMNNFFIVLYFPNVAVYLAAIIITNIILWISVFNLKTPKLVRNINIIIYAIIHYLLALVLNIITKNNLDIFSQTSVYGNQEAQAIIEFSSSIFMVWLVFLLCYKMLKKYLVKEPVPVRKKVVVKKVRALPENITEVPIPLFVKGQPKKVEESKTLEESPVLLTQLTPEELLEKQKLEKQLTDTQEKLNIALSQLKIQEETIKIQDEQKIKLAQEQSKLEEEQIKLQYEQTLLQQQATKLQQEKSTLQSETLKLQEENKKLQTAKKEESNTQQPKVDATTAIMQNLDGMLTLEDYKVLATILKEKQKKKNIEEAKEEIRRQEQMKFAQLHEAYKSVR